jgi:uncharacterized membrane protein YraQ (UPF0718 family)
LLKNGWRKFKNRTGTAAFSENMVPQPVPISASQIHLMAIAQPLNFVNVSAGSSMCTSCDSDMPIASDPLQHLIPESSPAADETCCSNCAQDSGRSNNSDSFRMRLLKETLGATWMVGKFMALAFLLEGLITLYVPGEWIAGILGSGNPLTIITAALLGVPVYTTSLTALPMISGLLTQGMNPAAALAFLIAGPVTTLPAMAAVWPLVARRVFVLYVSIALTGAILTGSIYSIISILIK